MICDRIDIKDLLLKILADIPPEIFYSLSRFNSGIVLCIIFVKVAGKQCNLKTISQMGGQTEILPHVTCIINVIFLEVRS